MKVKDLNLGDKILLGDYPFSWAIVTRKTGVSVRLVRPYAYIDTPINSKYACIHVLRENMTFLSHDPKDYPWTVVHN